MVEDRYPATQVTFVTVFTETFDPLRALLLPVHSGTPRSEAGRIWVNQVQLTMADFVTEVHEVHHPIAASLYYRQQKEEARRRSKYFRAERIPKFLGYFEQALSAGGKHRRYLAGTT